MEKDGGLTKAEREMIVVATSSFNNCEYCVIAHGAILRIRARNPLIADQIAVNYLKADITPRQRAMLDFGMKVCRDAQSIAEDDFADLARHGFSDDDIWDIAAIASFFALSNRMANFTGHARQPGILSDGPRAEAVTLWPLIVRRRPAPSRQVDRVVALGGLQRFLQRLGEMILDHLARDPAAQEIGPEEFAERRGVLGEAAGPP